MKYSAGSTDMLHGPLTNKIIQFAIPVALCSMLQQLFNSADTLVVGRFAGSGALAAVGADGELIALIISLSSGLSIGVNVILAGYIGCNKEALVPEVLHSSLLFAAAAGLALGLAGQFIAAPLLRLIRTPDSISAMSVIYLKIYFAGCPFLLIYDFASAALRSSGNSRSPFAALLFSGFLNIIMNLFFVIVCKMGVAGVAAATDLAGCCSACYVLYVLGNEKSCFHLNIRRLRINAGCTLDILRIGIPAAVQGGVFCFANIFVQAAVNSFGAAAVAGSAIAMNFEYFGYYLITAFGQSATTFVSQNYAAGNLKRCKKIFVICLISSLISCGAVTTLITLFRTCACTLFTSDIAVIQMACIRITLILTFEPCCSFYEIPAGVLRGMGHSATPAAITVAGTCALRIVWILTIFRHFHTFAGLFIVFPVSWAVTSLLMCFALYRVNRSATHSR
jgi:putative MATE family efflux protein